jgi:hypothetical protein
LIRQPWSGKVADVAMKSGMATISDFDAAIGGGAKAFFESLIFVADGKASEYKSDPSSVLLLPVFDSFLPGRNAVASLLAQIQWSRFFEGILPSTDDGIMFVLKSCTNSYTFNIERSAVQYLGKGDFHDTTFDSMKKKANYQDIQSIADSTKEGLQFNKEHCPLEINVYPTNVCISKQLTFLFCWSGHILNSQLFSYYCNAKEILRRSRVKHPHYCYISNNYNDGVFSPIIYCVR